MMITAAELTELRRLCAARPNQHFADLVMTLIRAYEDVFAERERLAKALTLAAVEVEDMRALLRAYDA